MTNRTKSALLLVVVLAIGMILGSLLTGAVANRRLASLTEVRSRMVPFIEEAIQPESEEQREAIREVLDAAAPRFAEIFSSTGEQMRALADSVFEELEPLLTEEQKERLEKRMRFGHGRRFRPPPEMGPRPERRPGGPLPRRFGDSVRRPPPVDTGAVSGPADTGAVPDPAAP